MKNKKHPLEDLLNLEEEIEESDENHSDQQSLPEVVNEHLPLNVNADLYDDKDQLLEDELEEIKSLALKVYKQEIDNLNYTEPKYKGRRLEAISKYLDIALSAVKEKKDLKTHKDKIVVSREQKKQSNNTYNAIFVGNRNDLLKMIASGQQVVEGDVIDINTEEPTNNENDEN